MKWITREQVRMDRTACTWVIRKFVDPQAEFLFVPGDVVLSEAQRLGATPFHAIGAELSPNGKARSFSAILDKYNLRSDPALGLLEKIISGSESKEANERQPEGPGLAAIIEGLRHLGYPDDNAVVQAASLVYNALYAYAQEMIRRGKPEGGFRG